MLLWISRQKEITPAKNSLKMPNNDKEPKMEDFKPKFILRVDSKTLYKDAATVIDVFRELNLNNLNFVTSAEAIPVN
jgi:biopolymer transport protein ExbD